MLPLCGLVGGRVDGVCTRPDGRRRRLSPALIAGDSPPPVARGPLAAVLAATRAPVQRTQRKGEDSLVKRLGLP